ncbi:MAG: methyltransferase domain-containing protein [Deltaproteobacteria bacterium]|nr:methyltransferase domain-containing protein [Deltaproteobacteria bacterium]
MTRDLSIDDPETTVLRADIIRKKAFLRRIYQTWYRLLIENIPEGDGQVAEIGSGAGFLKECFSAAITSEVFHSVNVDIVYNAISMPFKTGSLRSILLVDVLHHVPDPGSFFTEATRCVKSGGRCLMVEPWNTCWSRWIYNHLHHEPFDVNGGWTIPVTGPLSGANGALPWIIFERDREIFSRRFPEWRISGITPLMPLVYLLSGGVSLRSIFPAWTYPLFRRGEKLFDFEKKAAMFALIILDRI